MMAFVGLGLGARGVKFLRDVHSFVVTWRFQWRDDLPCRGMVRMRFHGEGKVVTRSEVSFLMSIISDWLESYFLMKKLSPWSYLNSEVSLVFLMFEVLN